MCSSRAAAVREQASQSSSSSSNSSSCRRAPLDSLLVFCVCACVFVAHVSNTLHTTLLRVACARKVKQPPGPSSPAPAAAATPGKRFRELASARARSQRDANPSSSAPAPFGNQLCVRARVSVHCGHKSNRLVCCCAVWLGKMRYTRFGFCLCLLVERHFGPY